MRNIYSNSINNLPLPQPDYLKYAGCGFELVGQDKIVMNANPGHDAYVRGRNAPALHKPAGTGKPTVPPCVAHPVNVYIGIDGELPHDIQRALTICSGHTSCLGVVQPPAIQINPPPVTVPVPPIFKQPPQCFSVNNKELCDGTHGCNWIDQHQMCYRDYCTLHRTSSECMDDSSCQWDSKEAKCTGKGMA